MLSAAFCSCGAAVKDEPKHLNMTEMDKKNLGNLLALYPQPMTVLGPEVEGKGKWRGV